MEEESGLVLEATESEWTMFCTSIADMAVRSSGCKGDGACCGGNYQTRW